jgi:hypothetical protein
VDVVTAQEDGARRLPDDELLDRATSLGLEQDTAKSRLAVR